MEMAGARALQRKRERVINDSKETMKKAEDQPTGTRDLTWKTPPTMEEKKLRAPASNTSLYRVRLQTPGIYTMRLIP